MLEVLLLEEVDMEEIKQVVVVGRYCKSTHMSLLQRREAYQADMLKIA